MTKRALGLTSVLLSIACGDGSLDPVAASFPTGVYEVVILASEIPARTDLRNIPGVWRISFHDDASFEAFRDNTLVVQGTFMATDEKLTVIEQVGSFGCTQRSGTYEWAFDGFSLSLQGHSAGQVTDPCGQRSIVLSLKPLIRIALPATRGHVT